MIICQFKRNTERAFVDFDAHTLVYTVHIQDHTYVQKTYDYNQTLIPVYTTQTFETLAEAKAYCLAWQHGDVYIGDDSTVVEFEATVRPAK
jgi:hypothetical protein